MVTCEVKGDDLIVTDQASECVLISRKLDFVHDYEYNAEDCMFNFTASDDGDKLCYCFYSPGHECNDCYLKLHNSILTWSRHSKATRLVAGEGKGGGCCFHPACAPICTDLC